MNDSSTKISVFSLKGTRRLRETADSRTGTKNEQRMSRLSCQLRKQGNYQRLLELYQMDVTKQVRWFEH